MTEQGTEYARRLAIIKDLAKTAAKELAEHERQVAAEIRRPVREKRLAG